MNRKRLLWIFLFLFLFSGLGLFLGKQSYENHRELHGRMTFEGRSVHLELHGQKKGNAPTILFLPGLNEGYGVFLPIQRELSKEYRSFLYDRLELNRPRTKADPRSVSDQVQDLHGLLQQLHIRPPYILVAHSIGGYHARLFSAFYPKEVYGVVLIESSHETQSWNPRNIPPSGELNISEIQFSAAEVRASLKQDVLRDVPLVVLTADYKNRNFPYLSYWNAYQKKLASLSKRSKHIIVENSGHMIPSEHPDAVLNAIKEVFLLSNTR